MKRCKRVVSGDKLIGYMVRCPACLADNAGSGHLFYIQMNDGKPGWTFNGNFERPTFRPSMRARSLLGPEKREHICHSFVTDGEIQYLPDCTHALAGQTIDLPELED